MRYTPLRSISDEEKRGLYDLLDNSLDIKYRDKIVLAVESYTIPTVAKYLPSGNNPRISDLCISSSAASTKSSQLGFNLKYTTFAIWCQNL